MVRDLTDDEITMLLKAAAVCMTGMASGHMIRIPYPARDVYTEKEVKAAVMFHTKDYSLGDIIDGLFKLVAQQNNQIEKQKDHILRTERLLRKLSITLEGEVKGFVTFDEKEMLGKKASGTLLRKG